MQFTESPKPDCCLAVSLPQCEFDQLLTAQKWFRQTHLNVPWPEWNSFNKGGMRGGRVLSNKPLVVYSSHSTGAQCVYGGILALRATFRVGPP